MQAQDKQITKLEVKVVGQPKPTTVWKKADEEIIPSEDFQIMNFDDGTSVLVINDVYPDDAGQITFEAHNPLGVAATMTELRVEGNLSLITHSNALILCFQVICSSEAVKYGALILLKLNPLFHFKTTR